MASHAFLPFINKLVERKQKELYSLYKAGEKDLLHKVAELAVLQDLLNDLSRTNKTTNYLEEKHHGI